MKTKYITEGMIPRLYGAQPHTSTLYNYVMKQYQRDLMFSLHVPPFLLGPGAKPRNQPSKFEGEWINPFAKPERSQDMACEVCGAKEEQTVEKSTLPPQLRYVSVGLSVGNETKVKQSFYVCDDCYPKIKKQIAEVAHVILALDEGECGHTD